jgi:hypothetical protein
VQKRPQELGAGLDPDGGEEQYDADLDNRLGRGTSLPSCESERPLKIDELTAREVQAEQERYDAIVHALPRSSADWDAAAASHLTA